MNWAHRLHLIFSMTTKGRLWLHREGDGLGPLINLIAPDFIRTFQIAAVLIFAKNCMLLGG